MHGRVALGVVAIDHEGVEKESAEAYFRSHDELRLVFSRLVIAILVLKPLRVERMETCPPQEPNTVIPTGTRTLYS